jgi:uncharacterized repeat protein (TIGR01451 family)
MRYITTAVFIASALLLSHCGTAHDGDNTVTTTPPTLTGTATTGIPVDDALITVINQTGEIATTETDEQGKFTISVADIETAPFLLKVDLPDNTSLFSIAAKPGVVNIHPLSNLIATVAYQEQGIDIKTAFDDPTAYPAPDQSRIEAIKETLLSALSTSLEKSGMNPATFDLLTTPLHHKTGFNALLQLLVVSKEDGTRSVISMEDAERGEVTELTVEVATVSAKPGRHAPGKEVRIDKKVKPAPIFSKSVKKATPASGTTVSVGQTITYTIDYINSGKVDATGVTITDLVHKRLTELTVLSGNGTLAGNKLTWSVEKVTAGSGGSVGFSAKVATSTQTGAITNSAMILSNENKKGIRTKATSHKVKVIASTTSILEIKKTGKGSGMVTSNPAGIDCGTDCSEPFMKKGVKVTLTATPDSNSIFSGWSGACSKKTSSIVVTIGAKKMTCTVNFNKIPSAFVLTIGQVEGGQVTIDPPGTTTACTRGKATCVSYPAETRVVLTAEPSEGYVIDRWEGDCAFVGVTPTCSLTMNAPKKVDLLLAPKDFLEPGSVYYVAPHGNDANLGVTRETPWRTLQHAADEVREGSIVRVADGTYEGFHSVHDGTKEAPIVFKASDKNAIINSRNARTPDNINIEQTDYIVIDGFIVKNAKRGGIRVAESKEVVVQNNQVGPCQTWCIFTAFATGVQILNNKAFDATEQHGIYVSNSSGPNDNPIIRGNVMYGNGRSGIQINGDCFTPDTDGQSDGVITGAVIENNIVYNNTAKGMSLISMQDSVVQNNLIYNNKNGAAGIHLTDEPGCGKPSHRNTVVNNTIVENIIAGIRITDSAIDNVIFNNILISLLKGAIVDEVGGSQIDQESNLMLNFVPPGLFVNPNNQDYHLLPEGGAVDAGKKFYLNRNAPAFDFEGTARPQGVKIDIGAYEIK